MSKDIVKIMVIAIIIIIPTILKFNLIYLENKNKITVINFSTTMASPDFACIMDNINFLTLIAGNFSFAVNTISCLF